MNFKMFIFNQRINAVDMEAIACKPGLKYLVIINFDIDSVSY
jgi:hypothetical protein